MKKIIFIFVLTLATICGNKVFALENDNNNDYKIIQAGGEENYLESLKKSEEKLKALDEKISKRNSEEEITSLGGGNAQSLSFTKTYPNYKQETSYYCGPASVKQAIQWINGSSASQSTYASAMGTNSDSGTIVYNLTRYGLNAYQSKYDYGFTQVSTMRDEWRLWEIVQNNILYEKLPVIAHAILDDLYMYNGVKGGHYITITGYYDDYLGAEYNTFEYVDSYSANYGRGDTFGVHDIGFYELYESLRSNGRYLIW